MRFQEGLSNHCDYFVGDILLVFVQAARLIEADSPTVKLVLLALCASPQPVLLPMFILTTHRPAPMLPMPALVLRTLHVVNYTQNGDNKFLALGMVDVVPHDYKTSSDGRVGGRRIDGQERLEFGERL